MAKKVSARSKRGDQLWIARDELTPKQVKGLRRIRKDNEVYFNEEARNVFSGGWGWERLVKTAKRDKMTPQEYALAKLIG